MNLSASGRLPLFRISAREYAHGPIKLRLGGLEAQFGHGNRGALEIDRPLRLRGGAGRVGRQHGDERGGAGFFLFNAMRSKDVNARHGKLSRRFLDAQAQEARIIFRIPNRLAAFEVLPAKTRNRCAGLDDAPKVRVVAGRDFHPVDEVGLGRWHSQVAVKICARAKIDHDLSELTGHKAVFAHSSPDADGLRWKSKAVSQLVGLLVAEVIDDAKVCETVFGMREGVTVDDYVIKNVGVRRCERA